MKLINLMNYMGQDIRFRPLGRLMLLIVRNTRLSTTCRIAGRRLVTAFAGAPAILLTNTTLRDALHDPKLLYRATAYTVKEMGLDTFPEYQQNFRELYQLSLKQLKLRVEKGFHEAVRIESAIIQDLNELKAKLQYLGSINDFTPEDREKYQAALNYMRD